jgi:hypothetical protein
VDGHTILKVVKKLNTLHPHASYAKEDTLGITKAAWSTVNYYKQEAETIPCAKAGAMLLQVIQQHNLY